MATTQSEVRGFSSPFEVPVPKGCEGWESMYPYYALFSEERRASEEARGWFRDGMHFPEPMFPFDFVTADSPYMCLGQANTRIFAVPPALGIDHRVLYGWVYMSANSVTDEAEIGRRAQLFGERAGYYFRNWEDLYGRWQAKVEETIGEIAALEVPDLPEIEDIAVVTEGRGIGSAHTLLVAYDRLLESIDRIWQYHFEFLNLGYAAYLVFYELCKQSFPDIPDQTIAKMVSGIDVDLFRPEAELGRLAGKAVELGIADAIKDAASEEELRRRTHEQRTRPGVARRLGGGQDAMVLLLQRQRLLPPSPLVDRRSKRSAEPPRQLHLATPSRRGPHPPAGRSEGRARSDQHRVPSAARLRGRGRGVRSEPGARAARVPVRREPQLLRRALVPHDLLEQGPGVRCAAGTAPVPRRRRGRLLSPAPRDLRRARRSAARVGGGLRGPRPRLLAADRREAQADHGGDAEIHAAAGARLGSGCDHRADDDHALGNHDRAGARVGRPGPRRRRDDHRLRAARPARSRDRRE